MSFYFTAVIFAMNVSFILISICVYSVSRKKRVFGKLLGVTIVGLGGALGYAWYDESFRDTIKKNIPYGRDVLDGIFVYLPDSPSIPAPIMT